jgi:hypothetical protein
MKLWHYVAGLYSLDVCSVTLDAVPASDTPMPPCTYRSDIVST